MVNFLPGWAIINTKNDTVNGNLNAEKTDQATLAGPWR
jgi:hypothetical protein